MIFNTLKKIIGSRNDRMVKTMRRGLTSINQLEPRMQALDDAGLRALTPQLQARYRAGEPLEKLLPEAFAVVREAAQRTLQMRHFDVQMIGGIALHQGKIAEMRTGEGKTLVATLAAYLNALSGSGIHIVTVNDYLANRDAEWMGEIYRFLGMSVGVVAPNMALEAKRRAYACDIVYGTNNEFGFDYLRDNMAFRAVDRMQGELSFAIIDEVDSILIDEARTPLIISGPTDESSDLYIRINKITQHLERQIEEDGAGDFTVDEKHRQIHLTDNGNQRVEELLVSAGILNSNDNLYDAANVTLCHHLDACLRSQVLFARNVDYIVRNGEVIIVDEFTGRTMPGRRWSDGLHQAIEAKEGVAIQNENQTLASITFQNYFRLYDKIAGMTGTAETEAQEFFQIYGLEVIVIPTHMPMIREDLSDLVYLTKADKFNAVIEDICDCHSLQQPVLVGTTSIETSEHLSRLLRKQGIEHQVLNAKQHQREAQVIAAAGRSGAVTIATNMAGRGTDIVLGGSSKDELAAAADDAAVAAIQSDWRQRHEAVLAASGLHIIGTERHDSRRIDNQLRGRSGRQGDPGSSRFYLALEDDLMRRFASDRVAALMKKLGMEEGEAIEHTLVTKAIENAQRKVEAFNFDMRKQLLEYDDVANEQRKEVYALRNELMSEEDISERIKTLREEHINHLLDSCIPPKSMEEEWDLATLEQALKHDFELECTISQWLEADQDNQWYEETIKQRILEMLEDKQQQQERIDPKRLRQYEKLIMLHVLDHLWKEHLVSMDHLRQVIGLRGYAQKNPKQEYKREAFEMFQRLSVLIKQEVIRYLAHVTMPTVEQIAAIEAEHQRPQAVEARHAAAPSETGAEHHKEEPKPMATGDGAEAGTSEVAKPYIRMQRKIGRNELCPCGSGKKFKHCHGRLQ